MNRRAFIAGGAAALAASGGAAAQPARTVARIGGLSPLSLGAYAPMLGGLREGLRELGWVEPKNLAIEYRYADGRVERFADLVGQIVASKVDVIVAASTAGILAAHRATTSVPIVMVTLGGDDIVASGVIASLARPGGNLTGVIGLGEETAGKRLQLLKEAVPGATTIGVLANLTDPEAKPVMKGIEAGARTLNVRIRVFDVHDVADIEPAFGTMSRERIGGVLVLESIIFATERRRIRDVAARNRLPALYGLPEHVYEGGVMAYNAALPEMHRRAAYYVDRILKGAKPAELAVEQPTKFVLTINLRAAQQIGLSIPQSVLFRADHVIR